MGPYRTPTAPPAPRRARGWRWLLSHAMPTSWQLTRRWRGGHWELRPMVTGRFGHVIVNRWKRVDVCIHDAPPARPFETISLNCEHWENGQRVPWETPALALTVPAPDVYYANLLAERSKRDG